MDRAEGPTVYLAQASGASGLGKLVKHRGGPKARPIAHRTIDSNGRAVGPMCVACIRYPGLRPRLCKLTGRCPSKRVTFVDL